MSKLTIFANIKAKSDKIELVIFLLGFGLHDFLYINNQYSNYMYNNNQYTYF